MKRRRRGTGSVEPMPDGTFRPRLPGNGERLRPYATFEEASEALDAALAALADGSAAPVGGTTLAAFGEEILDLRERQGVRAAKTDRSRWKTHVLPAYFSSWPIASVASKDVRAWLDSMQAKTAAKGAFHKRAPKRKLGRTTIQNTLNLLRVVLEAAVERELIPANPARTVRLPRSHGVTHEPWTYLLVHEQKALLTCPVIPEADRLLLAFAIGTGMRQGEIYNLELRDIPVLDEHGRLSPGRIIVRRGSRTGSTKGKRIRRIAPFGLARTALERWLTILPSLPNPHRVVWPLPTGVRRRDRKAPKGWRQWLKAAKLTPDERHDGRAVRFHDLRHTCASSLVAGWWGRPWRLEEVKVLLGHRSITTTERYAHLADTALDVAARETDNPTMSPVGSDAILVNVAESFGSHLGDLNPRPAVYENRAIPNTIAQLSPHSGATVGSSDPWPGEDVLRVPPEVQAFVAEQVREAGRHAEGRHHEPVLEPLRRAAEAMDSGRVPTKERR